MNKDLNETVYDLLKVDNNYIVIMPDGNEKLVSELSKDEFMKFIDYLIK